MSIELIDAIVSLSKIVAEENAALARPGYHAGLGELVAVKLRLVGIVEAEVVRLGDWTATVDPPAREELLTLLAGMQTLLAANADLLQRRIDLCDDLLGAIAREARRLTGGRASTYGARGRVAHVDQAVPIAVNASL